MNFILILFSTSLALCMGNDDIYSEELYVRDLKRGFVSLHFNFNILQRAFKKSYIQHYHLFPKSLGEIVYKYDVSELHLSLVRGFWDSNKWGYSNTFEAPGAAELWTWFTPNVRGVDRTWKSLANALSGHFCASLNFLGETQAFAAPRWAYRPTGLSAPAWSRASARFLRHAQLPRETVCTENLTPWLKLLPCKQRAGLAQLLNPMRLYASHYHAMTVHVRHVCADADCKTMGLELRQTLTVVFDRRLHTFGKNDWSLRRVLDRLGSQPCPLAQNSRVYVEVPHNAFHLHPEPKKWHKKPGSPDVAEFDVPTMIEKERVLDVSFTFPEERKMVASDSQARHPNNPWDYIPITAEKFATGVGNVEGGVRCIIRNHDPEQHFRAVYLDVVPWNFRLQYRSVEVSVNGRRRRPSRVFYQPGRDRTRPYHLELLLDLPPGALVEVSYRFSKALLRWTEYPPDANRGFFLPPSSISFVLPAHRTSLRHLPVWASAFQDVITNRSLLGRTGAAGPGPLVRLYSVPILVSVPTPDFSMPFNALCLACTAIAIGVGSIHNFTTRPVIGVSAKQSQPRRLIDRLRALVGLGVTPAPSAPAPAAQPGPEAGDTEKEKPE